MEGSQFHNPLTEAEELQFHKVVRHTLLEHLAEPLPEDSHLEVRRTVAEEDSLVEGMTADRMVEDMAAAEADTGLEVDTA